MSELQKHARSSRSSHTKGGGPPDPLRSQVSSPCPAVLFEAARNATSHATTQASSLPPSTPSSSWAILGAAHGTLRAASLESTHGRRCSSLENSEPLPACSSTTGAAPSPYHRRASLHPIAFSRLPPQHRAAPAPAARSRQGFGAGRRRGIGRRRTHAVLFSGVFCGTHPPDSGPPLHVCMLTDVRSNASAGVSVSGSFFVCHCMEHAT